MTTAELNRFIRACIKHGSPEAIELGREAFKRLQSRQK